MNELVTRCPSCLAVFRATHDQLEAAAGKVRCGACLVVFDARANQMEVPAVSPSRGRVHSPADNPNTRVQGVDARAPISDPRGGLPGSWPQLDDRPDAIAAAQARRSGRAAAVAAVAFAAVLGVAIQYLYFNVDTLAKQRAYRPWLERFCQLLPCTMPELRDISLIKARNLLIRTHPTVPGALQMEAVLVNEAPFEQRFPQLLLMFQDLQGAVVARRRFAPAEYLQGKLTGAAVMPPHQPIRFEVEFVDPGEIAVSYSLDPLD